MPPPLGGAEIMIDDQNKSSSSDLKDPQHCEKNKINFENTDNEDNIEKTFISSIGKPEYLSGPPEGFLYAVLHYRQLVGVAFTQLKQRQPQQDAVGVNVFYRLHLLSVKEFTVSAFRRDPYGREYQVAAEGLRMAIKKLSRGHAVKASYEKFDSASGKDGVNEDFTPGIEGRWRIPLSCYQGFFGFLTSKKCAVEGIPLAQLKAASIGAQQADKSYPSIEKLAQSGVPRRLCMAMAPYQRGGVDFVLTKNGRALIADEMGLGKTVQAIASMSIYDDDWPLLIFTPSSARFHWETELLHWLGSESDLHYDRSQSFCGDNDEKEEGLIDSSDDESTPTSTGVINDQGDLAYQDFNDFSGFEFGGSGGRLKRTFAKTKKRASRNCKEDRNCGILNRSHIHVMKSGVDMWARDTKVVIVSYGLATGLIIEGHITAERFPCVICDESHMLKNLKTKRTAAIVPLLKMTKRCLLLSGTPAFARPQELFPQLTAIGANAGGSEEWWQDESLFVDKYCKSKGDSKIGGKNLAELHALLESTVMIRRLKSNILKDLPQKIRQKDYVLIDDKSLKNELLGLMKSLRNANGVLGKIAHEQWQEKLNDQPSNETKANNVGLVGDNERKKGLSRLFLLTGMGKVPTVVTKLKGWLSNPFNGKICIFAHHKAVLDAIESEALKISNYIRIDGSTMPKSRQSKINLFQRNPRIRVALLGVTAAGVAVTLTAASTVWFAELFWTPAVLIQAEDRVHRIGQQSTVKCTYFIARGTLDEVLWKLVEKKFRALGEFVEGEGKDLVVHCDGHDFPTGDEKSFDLNKNKKMARIIVHLSDDSDVETTEGEGTSSTSSNNVTVKKKPKKRKNIFVDSDVEDDDLKFTGSRKKKKPANASPSTLDDLFSNDPTFEKEILQLGREERREGCNRIIKDGVDYDSIDDIFEEDIDLDPARPSNITVLSDDEDNGVAKEKSSIDIALTKSIGEDNDNATFVANEETSVACGDNANGTTMVSRNETYEPHVARVTHVTNNVDDVKATNFATVPTVAASEIGCHQTSMDNPIQLLSDDEDDVDTRPRSICDSMQSPKMDSRMYFYKMQFPGPSYGITIVEMHGKIIAKGNNEKRKGELGVECKPHLGDFVVSINDVTLPIVCGFVHCVNLMKDKMEESRIKKESVVITFAESKALKATLFPPLPSPTTVQEDSNGIICID